jgi:hypothetical protein
MATIWLLAILCALVISAAVPEDMYESYVSSSASNNTLNSLGSRAVTVIGSGVRTVWPLRPYQDVQLHTIHYCFASLEERADTFCQLQAGMRVWSDALGGSASATNGHSLGFREVADEHGRPILCYYPNTWDPQDRSGVKDPRVPDDILVVYAARYGRSSSSTVGYYPAGPFMRHRLELALDSTPTGGPVTAHEVSATGISLSRR